MPSGGIRSKRESSPVPLARLVLQGAGQPGELKSERLAASRDAGSLRVAGAPHDLQQGLSRSSLRVLQGGDELVPVERLRDGVLAADLHQRGRVVAGPAFCRGSQVSMARKCSSMSMSPYSSFHQPRTASKSTRGI